MHCPNCGFENPPEMLFCGMCGTLIARECSNCGSVMPLSFQFCGKCGTRFAEEVDVPVSEPATAEQLTPEPTTAEPVQELAAPEPAREPAPGALRPSPLTGERRLATVVIADVKSSTLLAEQIGTEAWVEVMNKVLQVCAAEIQRFGGEVDQFRGDGLVAFFGARAAHEDDPERAVLSAMTMQHAAHQLAHELAESLGIHLLLRVGVNTGEVIAANIGSQGQHSEDTTMGGAVALAARLESAAEPGTVLVSENTYRLTEHQFKWEALGEITVHGVSHPVAVYRPLAPLSQTEQQHRLQEYGLSIPLIGRDKEFGAIQKAILQLRDGVGGIVMISGAAGLGKSRLIAEVEQSIRREEALSAVGGTPITWLRGRARSYDQSLPHSMWIDVLRDWLGLREWESKEQELAWLQNKCRELWGDEYTGYYPYLAKFLSLPLDESFSSWIENLQAEGLYQQFFLAIKSWVEAIAKRGPVVIIFAEAHWADDASLDMLKHCLPLSDTEQVLWMVVFRPDPSAPTWAFNHYVKTEYPHRITAVEISGLSKPESSELLDRLIGPHILPDGMQANILEKAEGNPYYLTEIVRSLVDRGVLIRDPDNCEWQVTQPDAPLDLPDTLIGLLTARITRLSPVEQRVLQMAAVIGTVFWSELLTALIGKDVPIGDHLTALQRSELIRQRGTYSELGTEFAFISNLIRDAAYESVLSARQAQYHLTVAEYLERLVIENALSQYHGLIAYNFRKAKRPKKELAHTLLAAEYAQRIYANAEAIRLYTRVLELVDGLERSDEPPATKAIDEWRLEALTGLGQNYFGVGEVSQAEKSLQEAVALGRRMNISPKALTRLFYWLGEILFWQGHYEAPVHLGEEGLYFLGEDNKNLEAALMNQLVAIGCQQLGEHDKFIDFTQRTAGFIQNLPYTEELRPAYDHIIALYAYTLKDVPQAEQWLAVFKGKAESHHDLRAMGEVYNHHASIANRQGDLISAIGYYSRAIEHFNRIGDDKHICRTLHSLGSCYLQAGDLEKAGVAILESLEKARKLENKTDYALGYWIQAQILLCQGFREEASAAFAKAQELAKEVPTIRGGWLFIGLGQVHFVHGSAQEITGLVQGALENDPNLVYRDPYQAANILSRLERSYENPAEFRAYVERFRQAHPELSAAPFALWHLVPGEIRPAETEPVCRDDFKEDAAGFWKWVDPFDDCAYCVDGGLTIQAANERNLYHINRAAPRLICREPLGGDFTIQVICQAAAVDEPAIGGLLVWQDDSNWLCLELGARGPGGLLFRGFMDNRDLVFGRGSLDSATTHLRIEKRGVQVSAFCSPNGKKWYFTGSASLSSDAPIHPGLHANGHINRMIYPGAYPQGTAMRFKRFRLWGE